MSRLATILQRLSYAGAHRARGTVWETHTTPYEVRMSHIGRHTTEAIAISTDDK